MLTPETAIATVDRVEWHVTLVGAPDLAQRNGQPFIAERAWIPRRPDRFVTAHVSGRAIKVNGEIGKVTRYASFALVGQSSHDPAPSWLVEALKAAGVTW